MSAEDVQQQLAEDRTHYSWTRTALARERTFASWMRTGLGAVAVGFVIAKLTPEAKPEWLAIAIAIAFIAVGAVIEVVGFWKYRSAFRDIEDKKDVGLPLAVVGVVAFVVVLASLGGIVLLATPGR